MEKELQDKIKEMISSFDVVKYCYINKKDAFFLFKESKQDLMEIDEEWESDKDGGIVFAGSQYFPWAVLHNNEIIFGSREAYSKYCGYCDLTTDPITIVENNWVKNSPVFFVASILNSKGIKVNSPKYLTPIKNLFREVGLLDETRGKLKKESINKINRDKLIIQLYKEIVKKTKKRKPLPIKSIYQKLPNYDVSFATIRRVLKNKGY